MAVNSMKWIVCNYLGLHNRFVSERQLLSIDVHKKCRKMARKPLLKLRKKDLGKLQILVIENSSPLMLKSSAATAGT
jgi:hypothetical protein